MYFEDTRGLLDAADIAARYGLTRDYVTDKLTKMPHFPRPWLNVSQKTRKWAVAEIEEWEKKRRKRR